MIKIMQDKLKEGYKKGLSELTDYKDNLKDAQAKAQLSDHLKRLVSDLHIIADIQDKRKAYCTISHVYLNNYILNKISKKVNIPIELVRLMGVHEIVSALKGKKFDLDRLYQRRICSVMYLSSDTFKVFVGDEARRIIKKLDNNDVHKNTIKGTVASKGKVRGKVKVLMSNRELDKVKERDIIVTPMTTPDFVPVINKASAIITNEGGLTCHAAIISRELNKPCIIGTKNATKVLKDGDMVEVDAEKGIVKKL